MTRQQAEENTGLNTQRSNKGRRNTWGTQLGEIKHNEMRRKQN